MITIYVFNLLVFYLIWPTFLFLILNIINIVYRYFNNTLKWLVKYIIEISLILYNIIDYRTLNTVNF